MSDQATTVKKPYPFGRRARHYLSNLLIVGIIRTALALPYKARLCFVGSLVQHVLAPLAGYRRRGVVEPLDWRRLNAEQAPMQGMDMQGMNH